MPDKVSFEYLSKGDNFTKLNSYNIVENLKIVILLQFQYILRIKISAQGQVKCFSFIMLLLNFKCIFIYVYFLNIGRYMPHHSAFIRLSVSRRNRKFYDIPVFSRVVISCKSSLLTSRFMGDVIILKLFLSDENHAFALVLEPPSRILRFSVGLRVFWFQIKNNSLPAVAR